ncbi:MAG: ubiquinol-cytochrome c reductase iron-sulfur subunit, partial [Nitrosomonas sp.]|nr:ubiquinol-cytochrome c reductase iron-sulfur subunit [Nitrosomonas sp.]
MADSFSINDRMSGRRKFLVAATSVASSVAGAAIATPFL